MNKINRKMFYKNNNFIFILIAFFSYLPSVKAMDQEVSREQELRMRNRAEKIENLKQEKSKHNLGNYSNSMKFNTFQDIPLEVVERILSFINTSDLLLIQRVSKNWRYAAEKTWQNLTILDLNHYKGGKRIGAVGTDILSKSNFLQLKELILSGNQIQAVGVKYISNGNFSGLIRLDLSHNDIGDEGVKWLSKGNFPMLKILNLGNNKIGDVGANDLSKGSFPALQSLCLIRNKISDHGAESLSKGNFPLLESLILVFNFKVGYYGAKSFSTGHFPALKSFHSNGGFGGQREDELKKAFSKKNICASFVDD